MLNETLQLSVETFKAVNYTKNSTNSPIFFKKFAGKSPVERVKK